MGISFFINNFGRLPKEVLMRKDLSFLGLCVGSFGVLTAIFIKEKRITEAILCGGMVLFFVAVIFRKIRKGV
ncbi:MAG: hypothetical protein AAB740_02320 [Patescibacteria group bacterium]